MFFIFKSRKKDFSYSIRGKAFGVPLSPEDDILGTYTIGNEVTYKLHSFGIDYTLTAINHEEDDSQDGPEYDDIIKKNYFLTDYKFTFKQDSAIKFYLNIYNKFGHYKRYYHDYHNSNFKSDPSFLQSNTFGKYIEPGIGIGVKRYWKHFGVDVSANLGYRTGRNNITLVTSPTVSSYTPNVLIEKIVFYVRLNLFYEFVWD